MKTITFLMTLFLAATVSAETPAETLAKYRTDYPGSMTVEQIGELLSRVACDYKEQGMVLLGKANGANCPIPGGALVSCDYLVHRPTLTGHDVFRDAGPGGVTEPLSFEWGPGPEDHSQQIADGSRTLVEPVCAVTPPEPPVTPDPPVVVPDPPVVVPDPIPSEPTTPPVIVPPIVVEPSPGWRSVLRVLFGWLAWLVGGR